MACQPQLPSSQISDEPRTSQRGEGVWLQVVEEEVPCSIDDEVIEPVASDNAAPMTARDSLGQPGEAGSGGLDHDSTAEAAETGGGAARREDAEVGVGVDGRDDTDGQAAAAEVAGAKFRPTKLVRRELPPPPPPAQVVIGRRAQEALLDGEQLSDADTAALVANAILKLQEGYTAWRAATDDKGVPAVDDAGKPAHPQVNPVQTPAVDITSGRSSIPLGCFGSHISDPVHFCSLVHSCVYSWIPVILLFAVFDIPLFNCDRGRAEATAVPWQQVPLAEATLDPMVSRQEAITWII